MNYKKEVIRGFILHQSNPPCHDVDTNTLMPCTVTGQQDFQRLVSVNPATPYLRQASLKSAVEMVLII